MIGPRNQRGQDPTKSVAGAAARLRTKLQHLRGAENRRRVMVKIGRPSSPVKDH